MLTALNKHDLGHAAYYALAQLDTGLSGDYSAEFERLDENLRLAPELIGHETLGVFLSKGKGVYSSEP